MPVTADIENYRIYVRDEETRCAIMNLALWLDCSLPHAPPRPQLHRWFGATSGYPIVCDSGDDIPASSPEITIDELRELVQKPGSVLVRRRTLTSPMPAPPPPMPVQPPAAAAEEPVHTIDGEPVPLRTPVQCQVLVYPGHTDAPWVDNKGIIAREGDTLWLDGIGLCEKSHVQLRFPRKKSVVEQRCERLADLLLALGTAKTNTEVARWVRDNVVGIGDAYTVVMKEFPADE